MRRIALAVAAMILVLGLSSHASADDETTVSITYHIGLMEISIEGIEPSKLYDDEILDLIKRAAQLVRYGQDQFDMQKNFPRTVRK